VSGLCQFGGAAGLAGRGQDRRKGLAPYEGSCGLEFAYLDNLNNGKVGEEQAKFIIRRKGDASNCRIRRRVPIRLVSHSELD
jgi:hypothetical protein